MVLEFASQKEKAVQLIPGTDVKSFLGEGDDVLQTHAESGRSIKIKLDLTALQPGTGLLSGD